MKKVNININKKHILYLSLFLLVLFLMGSDISYAEEIQSSDLKSISDLINLYLKIGGAFTMVVSLGVFIFNIIKLGASSTNVNVRQQAIRGLILSGVSAAVLPLTLVIYNIVLHFMGY